jgi:hypothetical protein
VRCSYELFHCAQASSLSSHSVLGVHEAFSNAFIVRVIASYQECWGVLRMFYRSLFVPCERAWPKLYQLGPDVTIAGARQHATWLYVGSGCDFIRE